MYGGCLLCPLYPLLILLYAKGTTAVPGKKRARVIELLADNSTNNSSSNINKILVFGKEKTVFKDPKDRQVKHYYPKKKAVTLSIGSGQKEILMAQKNPGEGGTSL